MKLSLLKPSAAILAGIMVFGGISTVASPPAVGAVNAIVSDTRISDAVSRELMRDPGVSAYQVIVATVDGSVTLSGKVDNLLEKRRAAEIARTVKGVKQINNTIIVPLTRKTEQEIERDIQDALIINPATEGYEVSVNANLMGKVTLTGTVDSWQESELAEQVAASINGVVEIENKIDVRPKSDRSDTEIAAEVREGLRWDALVADALILTAVDDGNVTLSGTVGSSAERLRAHSLAWTAGVRSVDISGLKVDRWTRDSELVGNKYTSRSAAEIKKAVESALIYNPLVLSTNVDVAVDNDVVTLRGEVGSLAARQAAEREAGDIVGVRRVRNALIVKPLKVISDADIAASIRNALKRDAYVDRYEVAVSVNLGVARLSGTVDSYFEKAQAEDVTSRIHGVLAVINNLAVSLKTRPYAYNGYIDPWPAYSYDWYDYAPTTTWKSDLEIRENIEDELFWSPFVDQGDVTVTVVNGVARLTGKVESWTEWRAAQENAFDGGAIRVDNDLQVSFSS